MTEEDLTTQQDTTAQEPEPQQEPAQSSAETQNTDTPAGNEHMIPKSRFDEVNNKLKEIMAQQDKAAKEREAAERKALEEQNKFKELYEKEQAEKAAALQEAESLRIAGLRRDVAAEMKIPGGLVPRLVGTTKEEIEADAKALLEALPKSTAPSLDSRANGGTGTNPGMTDKQIKEMAARYGVSFELLKQQLNGA